MHPVDAVCVCVCMCVIPPLIITRRLSSNSTTNRNPRSDCTTCAKLRDRDHFPQRQNSRLAVDSRTNTTSTEICMDAASSSPVGPSIISPYGLLSIARHTHTQAPNKCETNTRFIPCMCILCARAVYAHEYLRTRQHHR